jgi:hypothetical protein
MLPCESPPFQLLGESPPYVSEHPTWLHCGRAVRTGTK